jgi:excisionase family DNA binding protein
MTIAGDLLLLDEVAQIARVSVETVRYWIKQGKLRSIRPGRRRLIRRQDLETFLSAGNLHAQAR